MGFFAYGHPFIDGNGRIMLIIHNELCHRLSSVKGRMIRPY
ncbi:Fic family protein [Vibrio litoralis]